jgi:translation initiation factor 1
MAKPKKSAGGLVYSTNPDLTLQEPDIPMETPAPGAQILRIRLDTKHRAGKAVSLIEGFAGSPADLDALGKTLKNLCGTGGSVKDGDILVQGDHREKILQWLLKNGYARTRKI